MYWCIDAFVCFSSFAICLRFSPLEEYHVIPIKENKKDTLDPSLWKREELGHVGHKTKELMTIYKALHLIDDIERLYMTSKEGGRGHASLEDCVDATVQEIERYTKKKSKKMK